MAKCSQNEPTEIETEKGIVEDSGPTHRSNSVESGCSVMAAPILTLSSSRDATRRSIMILRCLFVASLVLVIVICTSVSIRVIRNLEEQICVQTYQSVAANALNTAKAVTLRKTHVGEVMESIMARAYPDADVWPMVGLNGYQETASTVALTSGNTSVALIVLVDPSEAFEFETHAKKYYEDQGYPEDAGKPENDLDFGIRINGLDDRSQLDHTGNYTTYGSNNTILTPVLDHSSWGSKMLMYNVHVSSTAVDSIIECSKAFATKYFSKPNCTVITGFRLTDEHDLVALIYRPIYPRNDPTTLVGMMGLSVNFKDVLVHVVPDYFDGVTAVLSTSTKTADHTTIEYDTVTYNIVSGVPSLVGAGDLHDKTFHEYARSVVLNDFDTEATDAVTYTLTFYPSSLDQFKTRSPVAVSLGFILIILMSTSFFCLYDYLMRRQSNEQKVVLDLKRRFVRFISHEIRTPLNTVCMGLELLESDMQMHRQRTSQEGIASLESVPEESDLTMWHNITLDLQENVSSAVGILNDLLNYDKIESGTLQLEVGTVNIVDLAIKAVRKFKVQAANKDITLSLKILPCKCRLFPGKYGIPDPLADEHQEGSASGQNELDNVMVVGDEMRLCQVVCNLVSNSLKFTPSGGSVTVCMEHLSPPDCAQLRRFSEASTSSKYVTCKHQQRGTVRITVDDDGVGMTPDQLSQLFTEGVQFDPNRLQGGGGSGLGLSISKGIVERHNGFISAVSQGPGKGAAFMVELPLYNFKEGQDTTGVDFSGSQNKLQTIHSTEEIQLSLEDSSNPSRMVAHIGVQNSTDPIGPESQHEESMDTVVQNDIHMNNIAPQAIQEKPRHVLVVEDVLSSQKMLVRLLQRSNCTCVAVSNGQEAVDAVRATLVVPQDEGGGDIEEGDIHQQPFDTILMDFEMPVLNGPDATEKIRAIGYRGLILGVTGNVLSEDVRYFVSKGADSVVAKPVSMKVLKDVWTNPHAHGHGPSRRGSRHMLIRLSSGATAGEEEDEGKCLAAALAM